MNNIFKKQDKLWVAVWITGIFLFGIWDFVFLNRPAFKKVLAGFFNTTFIAVMVIFFSLLLGWCATILLHYLKQQRNYLGHTIVTFLFNLIRSVPQIVGILIGYMLLTILMDAGFLKSDLIVFVLMAFFMSIFIFLELVDLMSDRISHFMKLDFYNAMKVCGISERRIVNFDILWKNSRIHILNKVISIFGMAIFLQCSVDFIISVGLSTQVSSVGLPNTLGSLLANFDSKQDILMIGYLLTNPTYLPMILTKHLQGLSTAALIVFTLLCIHKISDGYAQRHHV